MITKEQVEVAEKRVAEAEKAIKEDKELIARYNKQIQENLYKEFADVINRSGISPSRVNIVVDRIDVHRDAPGWNGITSPPTIPHFEVVLHCIASEE